MKTNLKKKIGASITLALVALTSTTSTLIAKSLAPVVNAEGILSPEQYEDSMSAWSQRDHLYIHYLREANTQADYGEWIVWAWQKVPKDSAGTEYNWSRYDQSGAIVDIDISDAKFDGATKIGFLIVLDSSRKQTSGMWTSDSGGDVYITDVDSHRREDGSIHIFATQGNSVNYTFEYTGEAAEDPFKNDKGGDFVSKGGVNSSKTDAYPIAKTSDEFLKTAGVGYQIQVSSFADSDGDGYGDIKGITQKLPYLKDLNVDVLWLTPIQECESYHGYDVIDYYNVDSRFGSRADYRELIYEAHKLGIKVVMDLVVNHTSLNNIWFKRSASLTTGTALDNSKIDYRNFYQWKYSADGKTFTDGTKVPASDKGPWYRFGTTNYYYYGKFSTSMPELNYDYQGTRDAMVDVAKYWLGFGVDGFRIDAVKHVYMADEVTKGANDTVEADYDAKTNTDYSSNKTKNINFFREFSARIKSLYPNAYVVGENFDGWDQRISEYYQGVDSLFDFAAYYHFAYINFYKHEASNAQKESTVTVPNKYNMYNKQRGGQAINAPFTSNHDVERMMNHLNNTVEWKNSSSTETHTAITAANAANAMKKAKVYAANQILMPGLSFIYYGDELGMSGNKIANNASNAPEDAIGKDWNEDRWYRQPMKWSNTEGQDMVTSYKFSGYTVTWDDYNRNTLKSVKDQENDPNSMLSYFRKLTKLKNDHEAIIHGTYSGITVSGNTDIFAYSLSYGGETIYIYHNYGNSTASIQMNGSQVLFENGGASKGSLPSCGTIVLK
ncbi:MAG: hypothetical protein J1F31_06540 [Erysipelotrichales bacterium]|nr:hypothetical protein [Erysipelotrichales bacterium]